MRRRHWLVPLAVLLWHLAAAAAAPPRYSDQDGWGRAPECLNWNEDDGIVGGFQPVDSFQEIIPERLYPAIYKRLLSKMPAWRKCCTPSFNLLAACYQAGLPLPYPPFDAPDGPNVHAIVRISCKLGCGLAGRLPTLVLSPVTVDAQAHVPVDPKDGPVQFTQVVVKAVPKTRSG